MIRNLLVRGMAVGVVAGLLVFCVAKIFGEPQVDRAIAFEGQMEAAKQAAPADTQSTDGQSGAAMASMPGMATDGDHAADGHDHEEEQVSRDVQSTAGLLTAVVVYGASFGGLFALVYAFLLGRIGGVSPRGLAALLALAGFITIALVPDIKYPANPPAVGDPSTIGERTGLYLSMIVVSVGSMVAAVLLGRSLVAKHGLWTASIFGGLLFVVVVAIAQLILPSINEVPANFSADLLWRFRVASLGMHAVMWATLGLLFGYLTERSLQHASHSLRPAH